MMLVEETTIPEAALPIAQFREHLRLGTGFADDTLQDGLLERYLRAGLAAIEARTGKILISRSFAWTVTAWRASDRQQFPVAPIEIVTGITLIDVSGTESIVSEASWQLMREATGPAIAGTSGSLPRIPSQGRARIGFIAGFGPLWSDTPADLAQAVLLLASHFYEYRHSAESNVAEMPPSVSALIAPHRTLRTFVGGGQR